jgi:hypothetical protein
MPDMQEQKLFTVTSLTQYIEHTKMDALDSTTNNYRDAIIWGNYSIAAKFRKVEDSQSLSWDFSGLRKFRVTSYEILNSGISNDKLQAHQTVEIKYYNIQSMVEKAIVDKQLWEYEEEEKVWYLQGDLPQFQ